MILESENICRYCFLDIDPESELIVFCKCNSKVHRDCLIKWIKVKPFQNKKDLLHCEICREKYCIPLENIVEKRINTQYKSRLLTDEENCNRNFFFCLLLFCILMVIPPLIILYFPKGKLYPGNNYTNYNNYTRE